MSIFDRVIAVVLSLVAAVTALLIMAIAAGWNAMPLAIQTVTTLQTRTWEAVVVAGVLLLAGIHLASLSLFTGEEKAIVKETELGQVRVSLRAIENLVYRTVRSVKGVRDVNADITPSGAGVEIRVALAVAPDAAIPELAGEVQQSVEQYVEQTAGVSVTAVVVTVRAVLGETRTRVE